MVSVDFSSLITKLGHNLQEIRVRALNSILSKLEHGLVQDSDLVQEKHLFIRLLEWFNFPSAPLQAEVLELILRLSKHPSAVENLLAIGCVEFLTQLRPNCDAKLKALIDEIVENLFKLPNVAETRNQETEYHDQHCKYQATEERTVSSIPSHLLQPSESRQQPTSREYSPAKYAATPHEPERGYFTAVDAPVNTNAIGNQQDVPAPSCFKCSTFPWLPLTPTDRHVLLSTDRSLRSPDPSLVVSACEFLSDVVFQDFPAEVFLQRPSIVKSLLSLLCVDGRLDEDVIHHAALTLCNLVIGLQARLYFYQDPVLYTPKQDFITLSSSSPSSNASPFEPASDPRPTVIGRSDARHRGDGRDHDSSSSSSGGSELLPLGVSTEQELLDVEQLQALQFMQMTLPQFCLCVLEKTIPALKSTNQGLALASLGLLQQLHKLLAEAFTQELWDDVTAPGRELSERFSECLEKLYEVLEYHHHRNAANVTRSFDAARSRLTYVAVACFLAQLLDHFVPVDKVTQVVSECGSEALRLLLVDVSFADSHPEPHRRLVLFLQQLDSSSYNVYQDAQGIAASISATCRFLMELQSAAAGDWVRLLDLAGKAIPSIPYHSHMALIENYIHLLADICSSDETSPHILGRGQDILVKFLSHPLSQVRVTAYKTCLDIAKRTLDCEDVAAVGTAGSRRIRFLIEEKVLYETCCFGLMDSSGEVGSAARDIMLYLLQGELLMSPVLWHRLLDNTVTVLPVLQGFSKLQDPLGSCIMGLVETESASQSSKKQLPKLERLRGVLRLMFIPDIRVRSEGLTRLAYCLTQEEGHSEKLPVFSELDVKNLTNIFLVKDPKPLGEREATRSVFQVSDLEKVYGILKNHSVDSTVRKSAIQQIAVIITDASLYKAFVRLGGVDRVLSLLFEGVTKGGATSEFLPGCVQVLLQALLQDSSLRHQLARDIKLYYALVRAALQYSSSQLVCCDVASILIFLLFNEMASVDTWSAHNAESSLAVPISLPMAVTRRYKLPFLPISHHAVSPNRVDLPPASDPLLAAPYWEMLRLNWNIAWHDGIDSLLDQLKMQDRTKEIKNLNFSERLQLTFTDKVILRTSNPQHGLRQCINDILNATTHADVLTALQRMLGYLACGTDSSMLKTLLQLHWQQALTRFLQVVPSSVSDEKLLTEILRCLVAVMNLDNPLSRETCDWLRGILELPSSSLLSLICQVDPQPPTHGEEANNVHRLLSKQVLSFLSVYTSKLPYSVFQREDMSGVAGRLSKNLLLRLNLADAPHFYNLASLEATLQCLLHVTARRGWSSGCPDTDSYSLCKDMLNSLLEVVSAFHIGRGGISMSYMGKGVTRSATLCLRHLACQMETAAQNQDWSKEWLFSKQSAVDVTDTLGLNWLIPLWAYRDPEVRAAGFGIASALASTATGCVTLTTHCQHIPGGVWGAAFSILLDQSECSQARQAVALLLVNLTAHPMPSGSVATSADTWQGPIVQDQITQVSLVGTSALMALLHHSNFYPEMVTLLSNYYPQSAIHPVSIATSTSDNTLGSQSTLTTSDTATPIPAVQNPALPITRVNQHPVPDFSSTPINPSATLPPRAVPVGGVDSDGHPSPPGSGMGTPSSGSATPASFQAGGVPVAMENESYSLEMPPAVQYQSVATPCLVAAICRLLQNLLCQVPEDTVTCLQQEGILKLLISMIDASLLDSYCKELLTIETASSSTVTEDQYSLSLRDLFSMQCGILQVLRACVVKEHAVTSMLLTNTEALGQVTQFLGISIEKGGDLQVYCQQLWETVLVFYSTLLALAPQHTVENLGPVLTRHWGIVSGCLEEVLGKHSNELSSLQMAALNFLAVLLSEEGKRKQKNGISNGEGISLALNQPTGSELESEGSDDDIFTNSSGAALCKALIKLYDVFLLKPSSQAAIEKQAISSALRSLLAVCLTAKTKALQAGFVESQIEHIKHLHVQLNMEALQLHKNYTPKKDDPLISQLLCSLNLLRNFLYGDSEVKMAAYEAGLSNVIHKLWSWCLLENTLLLAVLGLLQTYTAKCTSAASSLAFTSAFAIEDQPTIKAQHNSNSLVHCIIKLTSKESKGTSPVTKVLFSLLATLSLSTECRGILWKSNFLHGFSLLNPKRCQNSKQEQQLALLWLQLLRNLSFSNEGQQMILKVKDALSLLLEYGSSGQEALGDAALHILRNLCFHSANKPKLLANGGLLPYLVRQVSSGSEQKRQLAVSALQVLLHNNQKAKVSMKNANLLAQLQEVYTRLAQTSPQQGRLQILLSSLAE